MIFSIENIEEYLHNDEALKKAPADALEQFAKENPYSGFLQLLYCKYLHLHNDIKLEEQLEKCSLTVSDRKRVYELLFQPVLQQQIIEHEIVTEKEESSITIKEEDFSQKIETENSNKELEPIKNNDLEEEVKTIDELEQNILTEAVNASIQVDISEYAKSEDITLNNKEEEKYQIEEPEDIERTFINWFEKPKIKKTTKSSSSIIDDFLQSGKNKEKQQKEVFSPSNIAKLSLVSNTQFVTETLATIYAKQGQIDKAIEIYQQLSLKNPEKKTFFASRIRFLKEKQQYNK